MDSSYLSPYKNVYRASSESQRLARINATPYDSFNDSQTSIASTASQKLVSFFKDKMSGVVSGLKGFFNPQDKPLLSSVVLTNSVTLPYIPAEKLNSISSAIQDTMKKPEYQDKYNFSLNSSIADSRKTSVQNVMKYYKDVSVDKVREKIQRQDSKALDLSVSCAVKPKPLYSSVNTSINSSRLDLGKNDLNVHGKRELRSILHDQNKTAKGNKKVSFVPELKRVDFPSHRNPLNYQKSSSSIIKYTSSDDEDGTFVEDLKQKKLFANGTKIFIKPQTLNVSVVPTRKLKVNPFQKKILEKSSQPKSHKMSKKQFPEDFARKFNHENSFGSDNLVNDSKLETDSDESNLHQNTFDHKNFINSLAKKKNQRSADYDSSSEISEKESPKQQLSSPKHVAPLPLEEDEVDIDGDVDREESNSEEEEKQMPVEEPVKKVQEPAPVSKPTSSLFGNLTAAVANETKPTENNTPKLGGSLFSNSTLAAETKKETTPEAPKSSLFSFSNNTSTVSAPKETTSSGLFGGNTSTETPKPVETPKPAGSLFGSGLFGNKTEQKAEEPKPAVVEAPQETVEAQKPAAEEKPAPIARSDSQVHSIFANLNRSGSTVSNTNNPFLSAASSQPKSINFSSLIGGGGPATENKPAEPIVESQPQNNETTMESSNQPAAEPAAPKLSGFLGLISQNNNQGSSMFSNTLNTSTSYSWMNTENNEQKSNNLFGGVLNQNTNNNNQSSMFTQNAPVNPFGGSQGGMNFEGGMGENNNNNNSMFGGNSTFGNNNNSSNSGNPFTGLSRQGSSMNNGLFGGSSSMGGGMFGGNSGSGGSMENNPFLSNQNSSFGGGSGGFSGGFGGSSNNSFMGSGGGSFGGSAKKGKQKERAF